MFSERRIFQQTTIYFSEDGIKIPGYYRDHLLKWNEISEVVVREDFLTLFNTSQSIEANTSASTSDSGSSALRTPAAT